MCGQKKINKSIHKTLKINYNFPSKVYEKSKVRSIDLNTDKLFSWTRAAGRRLMLLHYMVPTKAAAVAETLTSYTDGRLAVNFYNLLIRQITTYYYYYYYY